MGREEAVAIRRRNELDNRWSLAIALDRLGERGRAATPEDIDQAARRAASTVVP